MCAAASSLALGFQHGGCADLVVVTLIVLCDLIVRAGRCLTSEVAPLLDVGVGREVGSSGAVAVKGVSSTVQKVAVKVYAQVATMPPPAVVRYRKRPSSPLRAGMGRLGIMVGTGN